MMALFKRIIRLFKADLHGIMDQIENQELLLKQHLRDMQASLVQKEATLKQLCRTLDQLRQNYETTEKERERLEVDLTVALKNDRDDIGRMLIKKLNPLSGIQSDRSNHIDRLTREIAQFRKNLEQQRMQYEQLHQKAIEYFLRDEEKRREDYWPPARAGLAVHDLSDEEVEIELLQRKEAVKGGAAS